MVSAARVVAVGQAVMVMSCVRLCVVLVYVVRSRRAFFVLENAPDIYTWNLFIIRQNVMSIRYLERSLFQSGGNIALC